MLISCKAFRRSHQPGQIARWLIASASVLLAAPLLATISHGDALAIFADAKAISDRDDGKFWGMPLYGPMILVDPADQAAIANVPDDGGKLKPKDGLFEGVLPPSIPISDTPIDWSGKRWTELMLPLQPKSDLPTGIQNDWRSVLLAHEMFHRIQPALGLSRPEQANVHLDTLDGRYLLQLEWRALAAALRAPQGEARRAAIADALLFRGERYQLYPKAASSEAALEIDEGVPEYTGVRLGLQSPAARVRYAIYDLSAFVAAPSFVRSFAYATGPAYGLLLDGSDPMWRTKLNAGMRFDQLLASAVKLAPPTFSKLKPRKAVYDAGGQLHRAEVVREEARQLRIRQDKQALVDGPVLTVPLHHANYGFNPQTVRTLDGYGVVYPTLHLSADWGVLDVKAGRAMMNKDMTAASVSLDNGALDHLSGQGWTLSLKKGWVLRPGKRAGDFNVVIASSDARHGG